MQYSETKRRDEVKNESSQEEKKKKVIENIEKEAKGAARSEHRQDELWSNKDNLRWKTSVDQ